MYREQDNMPGGVAQQDSWRGFKGEIWRGQVDVRDFIQQNYQPYEGDAAFLAGATERTQALWQQVLQLMQAERAKGGPLDFDTQVVASITSHPAGYIDQSLEKIVGLQTEAPLKRAMMPLGGSAWSKLPARPMAVSWIRR